MGYESKFSPAGSAFAVFHKAFLTFTLTAVCWLPSSARALTAEEKAFKEAFKEFSDRQYHQAEMDFTAFLNTYSNSVHATEAVLCQAESQLGQSNNTAALNTLQARLPEAGDLAPDYIFYIARATNALGDHTMAATGFANLIKHFPQSPLRLEAAFDEADAWSKLKDWPRVIELLSPTNRAFSIAALAAGPSNEFAASGQLLLSKAYLEQSQPAAGEAILRSMTNALNPELVWERQFLLCQSELAQGRTEEAEADTTNLVARTETLGSRPRALSLELRGEILDQRGKLSEALECYTNNLADDHLPEALQREALANALQLMFRQAQSNAATALLESLAQRPKFGALDLVRLDLGELCLAAAQDTNAAGDLGTNLLQRAGTNFESVIRDFPNSPWRGRAHFDLGWRQWADTNITAARTNFLEAVNRLLHSQEQAVARFKLGDAEFYGHNYAGALSNYEALIRDYGDMPAVTNKLFDLALYKILEASIALGDETRATNAAAEIMDWFPSSYYGGHGLLLLGEDRDRKNDYARARQIFTLLAEKPTQLKPEAEYAIARTYGLEGNWPAALPLFDQWVTNHPQSPLLSHVEFDRALAYDKAGQTTNAFRLMTNFVDRFSTNSLAPWAQNWIADYYFNLADFEKAEKNYEELYGKWPGAEGDLPYRARFMAGKSALGRGDPGEAAKYFLHLVNDDPTTPPSIVAQGYYALADTFSQQFTAEPTNNALLDHAIAALSKLTNGAPTNIMAPLVFGRLGDYYLQGKDDAGAKRMYEAALACSNVIDAPTRSQAEIGLGLVASHMGQLNDALAYYDKALYDSDQTDPFWINQAGQGAALVCEQLGHWDAAIKVYERVMAAAPALRPALEKKIAAAQRNLDAVPN